MLIAYILRLMVIPLVEKRAVYVFFWCISPECKVLRHVILEHDTAFLYLDRLNDLIFASAADVCSSQEPLGINLT